MVFQRSRLAKCALLVALPLLPVAQSQAQSGVGDSVADGLQLDTMRIDSVFSAFNRETSPGCALGIIRDGRTLYARGYGMANLETGTPITPRTVFDIGSTSKQFTAASIALLVADGRISLDDDVRKFIPELPTYGEPITVRQLLQHTSGIRDYIGVMYLAGSRFADMTTDAEALDAIVRQQALNFEPGSEHLYSNSGYFLASVIVQRVSGMSLPSFAMRRIFQPLGMTSTLFRDDHALVVPARASAYAPRDSGGFEIDLSNWEQTGDGAVHTTVEDLARWDLNFYNPTVGGAPLLERLLTTGRLDNGERIKYALGLYVDSYRGLRLVHHGGSWAGYRAELMRFPEQRVSIAVLCNLATAGASGLATNVADVLLASKLQPAPELTAMSTGDGTAPQEAHDRLPPVSLNAADLAGYAGVYDSAELRTTWTLAVKSGTLVLAHRSLGETRLEPDSLDAFTAGPVLIRFQRGTDGQPTGFSVSMGRARNIGFQRRTR